MDYVMGMRQIDWIRNDDLWKSKFIILIDSLFDFRVGVFNFCSEGWRGILNGIVMLRCFGACCFCVVYGGRGSPPHPGARTRYWRSQPLAGSAPGNRSRSGSLRERRVAIASPTRGEGAC